MRTEQEMFDLILDFANQDERVRAVYMNGSRANPNAPIDPYMDFDIVYVVHELESFISNQSWLDIFGERLILQMPETMRYPSGAGHFNWLMLFKDGNRIDLTLIPLTKPELIDNDSATIVLLDKDNLLPAFPPASDKDYITTPPSRLFYESCCNNFFWCMQNVAKGIVRDELPYAMEMYHFILNDELKGMVAWYIGTLHQFTVASGKMGKYFKKFLSPALYEQYTRVYCDSNPEHIWDSLFTACDLFRFMARHVADSMGYTYNARDDEGIMTYLHWMKERVH